MFTFAKFLVRHKVGTVAVLALAVFIFMPDADDQQKQPSSPWSENAPVQIAQVEEESLLDTATTAAVDYLDGMGFDASHVTEGADRFDDTAEAFADANSGN